MKIGEAKSIIANINIGGNSINDVLTAIHRVYFGSKQNMKKEHTEECVRFLLGYIETMK